MAQQFEGQPGMYNQSQDVKSGYQDPSVAKLFVGQVPSTTSESALRQLFETYGNVAEVVILKDNRTQQHKGCAFVTFSSRDHADKAISALDGKHQLPGAKKPLAVRYAGAKPPEEDKNQEYKLYIGMLARNSTEDDVKKIFEPYGVIKEVFVIKQADGKSKGAAFVKYMRREDAERAIKALDGRYRDKEAPGFLQIRFAHTKQEKALMQQNNPLGGMGGLSNLGLAGLSGAGANSGFNSLYGFGMGGLSGMGGMSGFGGQQAASANPLAAQLAGQGQLGQFGGGFLQQSFNPMAGLAGRAGDTIKGPPGCNLFIYNLPLAFTDTELAALFANFGTVLSSHVQRDKATGASKGFGFVSFDNPQSANAAIASLDNFVLNGRKISVRQKKENGGVGKPY